MRRLPREPPECCSTTFTVPSTASSGMTVPGDAARRGLFGVVLHQHQVLARSVRAQRREAAAVWRVRRSPSSTQPCGPGLAGPPAARGRRGRSWAPRFAGSTSDVASISAGSAFVATPAMTSLTVRTAPTCAPSHGSARTADQCGPCVPTSAAAAWSSGDISVTAAALRSPLFDLALQDVDLPRSSLKLAGSTPT